MPATSQLDWLNSTTAMIVLFWSRVTRDLLRACPGAGRGRSAGASRHSIGYLQRRSCHVLAARPIASSGTAAQKPSISAAFRTQAPLLIAVDGPPRPVDLADHQAAGARISDNWQASLSRSTANWACARLQP